MKFIFLQNMLFRQPGGTKNRSALLPVLLFSLSFLSFNTPFSDSFFNKLCTQIQNEIKAAANTHFSPTCTDVSQKTTESADKTIAAAPRDACNNLTVAQLGGTVWEDWNYNGIFDETVIGVEGVEVRLYDCDGNPAGTTVTNADGDWTIGGLGGGALPGQTAEKYRVEFILPAAVQKWANPTRAGADSGTNVQFAEPGNCVNLGVSAAADYCQDNPRIALACYENGQPAGNNGPGLVSFRYNASGLPVGYETSEQPTPTTPGTAEVPLEHAEIQDIGAVEGTAWQSGRQRLFLTSFIKRFVGLRDGPGYIYAVDFTNGTAAVPVGFDLDGVVPANGGGAIDFGEICRDAGCANDAGNTGNASDYTLPNSPTVSSVDLDAFPNVGTMSYGDADMAEDGKTLFAVNLFQRALITVDVSEETGMLPGEVNQYLLDNLSGVPTCANGIFRPWALAFEKGRGYWGGVCDASISQDSTDLRAHVLSFDPENVAGGFTPEVDFALDYNREHGQSGPAECFAFWNAWADDWNQLDPYTNGIDNNFMGPQPILGDIEFNERGDMILGFIDRFGHQNGRQNRKALAGNTENVDTNSEGDLIQICRINGTWAVEGSANCPVNDDNINVGDPKMVLRQDDGVNNVGEFYYEDYFTEDSTDLTNFTHTETATGRLALIKGTQQVISIHYDPLWGPPRIVNSQGVVFHNTYTGAREDAYQVVKTSNDNQTFAKANGLGDMEAMCNAAPLEIGNYVWEDENRNGVQDACEPPIVGVTVELVRNGVVTATTVTDAAGNYYFSHSDVAAQNWVNGTDSLRAEMRYTVRIADVNDSNAQPLLENLEVTSQSTGQGTNAAANDNDAALIGNHAEISFTTGLAGSVNHNLDFGFRAVADYPDYQGPDKACAETPCHFIDDNIYLGTGVDGEPESNGTPTGDGDTDDGILFGDNLQIVPGNTLHIPVLFFNNTGSNAFLRIWIDWNGDGDFEDANEQAADNTYGTNAAAQKVSVSVTVPADADITKDIALRARLSTDDANSATPCGTGTCAADGEIEDFLLRVDCPEENCVPVQLSRN